MDEVWRRDIPQWHDLLGAQWGELPKLRVARGVEGRVASRAADIEESASLMLNLPPGWTFAPPEESGTLELFVVGGSLVAQGQRLEVGGFVAIPGGCAGAHITAPQGAQVLAFWNQFPIGSCYPDGGVHVHDTRQERWTLVEMENIPHGTFFKPLRTPFMGGDGFGGPHSGNLSLIATLPSFHTCDSENHDDAWEEIIGLGGDMCFALRGSGGPGLVVGNPARYDHGPYGTQRGHYAVMHALEPIRVNFSHRDGYGEAMDHYHATEPLFGDQHWVHDWDQHTACRKHR